MESVKRYTAQIIGEAHAWEMVMGSDFSKVDAERRRLEVLLGDRSVHIVALNEDLDRITAEREALQLLLNNRDDLDDQLTSLEQRRYAEQQAREAAERRVEELEGLLLKLKDPTDEMVEAGNEAAVVEMEHDDLRSYGWINNSDEVLSAMIEAALNPTAEAESHEA